MENKSIICQPKFDGIRLVIHRRDKEVKIFTEDRQRDRANIVPQVIAEVRTLEPNNFILDTEFVIWRNGEPIPREKMMSLVVGKEPIEDDIHVNIHDVLWWDDKAINELPYRERLNYLDKLLPKDLKYLKKTLWWEVTNRKEFDEALKKAYAYPGSEGSVLKSSDSQYLPGVARTVDWCVGGDTPIVTIRGLIKADRIAPGDFVLSKDLMFHRVLRVAARLATEEDQIFEVKAEGNETFLISGNHEIFVSETIGWQLVEKQLSSNFICTPRKGPDGSWVLNLVKFRKLHRAIGLPLYDFEIEDEHSYCTPSTILHNSKIKIVKEISCKIVGRIKKAMPFETIGRDQPNEDITGEEALRLYKRLQEKSNTWIFRCALKDGEEYVTIDTEDTVTKSDLEVKWNSKLSKPKWQGLDNPELWEMLKGFAHREIGAQSYGATYAKSFDIEPKLGMIVTVAPVQVIKFEGEDSETHLSWMFPKVRELKPESKEPDDVKDLKHLIEIRK